jgi:hypothetical protein
MHCRCPWLRRRAAPLRPSPFTGIFGYGKLLISITKLVAFTKFLVTLQDRARQAFTDFQSPSRPFVSPLNIAPEPSQ